MGSENSESESQNSAGTDIEKKILVVDDEPMVREVVGEFLSMKGYEVDTADRGAAALEMAGREKYSLILSDLKMPGMSGIELLKELKARRCEASVIVMTGYAELESAIDALKVGAYDFIRKPFNFDELLISVERALELVHLKRMTRDYQVTLERKVMEQSARIRDLFTEAVGSLTFAIEAKDEYTMGHSERVTRYSEMLAEAAGLRYETKRDVVFAAQLHDIGKLKIP